MDYKVQLLSFLISFIYGIFYYFVIYIFKCYVKNKKNFVKYLLATFLALDLALLYIAILYHVNNGIVHIYFLMIGACGVMCGARVKKMSIAKKWRLKNCK